MNLAVMKKVPSKKIPLLKRRENPHERLEVFGCNAGGQRLLKCFDGSLTSLLAINAEWRDNGEDGAAVV